MYQFICHMDQHCFCLGTSFSRFGGKLKEAELLSQTRLNGTLGVEKKYAKSFLNSLRGQKAVSIRMSLGSLIIQERLQLSDTVEQITENPYLQYFIGPSGFQKQFALFIHLCRCSLYHRPKPLERSP